MESDRPDDVSREVVSLIQAELQQFVLNAARDKEDASTILDDYVANIGLCEALNRHLEARVAARYGAQVRWNSSSTWALVRTILERVDLDTAQESPNLFAAKVLLGIDVDYSDDTEVPGRDGMTLAQLRASDRRLRNLRLEKHLDLRKAFVLKLFPHLNEYTALRMGRPAVVQIGVRLAEEVENELRTGDIVQYQSNTNQAYESIQAFQIGLVARLETPPGSYYPPNLGSQRLSSLLRLEKLSRYFEGDDLWPIGRERTWFHWALPFAREALHDLPRVAVLGDTGSGKSTIAMAHLADSIGKGNVGVFIRAAELARRAAAASPQTPAQIVQSLLESFEDWLGRPLDARLTQYFSSSLSDARSIIVIDAIDEIDDEFHREAFLQLLSKIDAGAARVLLTSRMAGYKNYLRDPEEFVVVPLSADASHVVLQEWFSETDNESGRSRAEEFVKKNPTVASNPLILGLVALVSGAETPPRLLGELFRRCVEHFLVRIWKPNIQRRGDDLAIGAALINLKRIAWNLSFDGTLRSRVSTDQILHAAGDEALARVLIRTDGLLLASSINTSATFSGVSYKWLHSMFQEHLMGSYLADQFEVDADSTIRQLVRVLSGGGRWQEVAAHAISLLSSNDQFTVASTLLDPEDVRWRPDLGSGKTLQMLVREGTLHDGARSALARKFASEGRWEVAFLFDASVAFRDVLRAQDEWVGPRRIERLTKHLSSFHEQMWNVPSSSETLKAYESRPGPASDWILPLLAHTDFSMAMSLAIRDQNPLRTTIFRLYGVDHGPELAPNVAESIVDSIVAQPLFPIRRACIQALDFAGNGIEIARARIVSDSKFALVGSTFWLDMVSDSFLPGHLIDAALRGALGPSGALEVGASFPEQARALGQTSSRDDAELAAGRLVFKREGATEVALAAASIELTSQNLANNDNYEDDVFDREPTDLERLAIRCLEERVDRYDPFSAHTVVPLSESIAAAARFGSLTELATTLRLSPKRRPLNSDAGSLPRDSPADFSPAIEDLVIRAFPLYLKRVNGRDAWDLALSVLDGGDYLAEFPLRLIGRLFGGEDHRDRVSELFRWIHRRPLLGEPLLARDWLSVGDEGPDLSY